jgi:hypothetical protein
VVGYCSIPPAVVVSEARTAGVELTSTAILACEHALSSMSLPSQCQGSSHAHKITGTSSGTFSEPLTSIVRKNEHIAELASKTST